jgi:hypothetical protein
LPWNPSRLEQRAGRVDRLGQRRPVHELALVAADTSERLVIAPLLSRARRSSHSTGGLRMLDAISESRVADVVMSGADVDGVDITPAPQTNADATTLVLDAEAAEESARLSEQRRLIDRSNATARSTDTLRTIATTLRRRGALAGLPTGLILTYRNSVECDTGQCLHSETVTIRVVPEPSSRRLTAAAMRRDLQPLVVPVAGPLTTLLDDWRSRMHERVAALQSRVQVALSERLAAMAALRESAARRLVQPGLFQPGAASGELRPAAADATDDTDRSNRDSGGPLRATTTLLAAIRIHSRERW